MLCRPVATIEYGEELRHVEPRCAPRGTRRRIIRINRGKEALALREWMQRAIHVVPEIAPIVPALLPIEPFGLGARHLGAGLRQELCRCLNNLGGVGRDPDQRVALQHGDAQALCLEVGSRTERHGSRLHLAAVGTGDNAERRLEILHGARQWPEHAHIAHGAGDARQVGHMAMAGHAPFRRLQREDAVVVRGIAHRTTDVAAELQRREACRHSGSAAAGRAAGRTPCVPGVLGRTEQRTVGLKVGAQFGDIGLAEDDRTRRAQSRDQAGVALGHVVLERRVAGCRVQARDVEGFLDGDRHAMQWPELATFLRPRPVGGARGLHRSFVIYHHQGIDRPVQPRDAFQVRLSRLDRAQPAVSYGASKPRGGLETRIHACLPCSAPRLAA